jgi:LPXTG-motif cell wall-anchored protein
MNALSKFALAGCAGILGLAIAPNANADVWNKKTILTVNETIQVPGKVLPPGKYVMRLQDSPANRHIVQVFNEDENQLLTTVLAIPNYRLQPTGDTKFTFWESAPNEPKPLRSWFYPGDSFGQEFVYPKDRAVQIAQYTKENVPTTTATAESDLATAEVAAVTPEGVEGELDQKTYTPPATQQAEQEVRPATPAPAAEPAQTTEMPRQTAQADIPQQTAQADLPAQEPDTSADRQALPETGSPVPLIALAGMLSLAGGAVFRRFRR